MNKLERYYEKFDESKRLSRRHGEVEFFVTNFFIQKYLKMFDNPKIVDIGAGTGAYSVELSKRGYDTTAVEFVSSNLEKLRKQRANIKTFLGDARNLDMLKDDSFDITLLLGPMYHQTNLQDKLKALNEAKRVTKKGGYIFVAYYMNEYGILTNGFKNKNILQAIVEKRVDTNFHVISKEDDLYSFERLEDIDYYKNQVGLTRETIFSPDGASDYMRDSLNKLTEEEFELFKKYQLSICERPELLGAGSHLVDVLKKC